MTWKKDTFINQVRTVLTKFEPDIDRFTSTDLRPLIDQSKWINLPGTLRGLEILGEIVKVKTVKGMGRNNGGKLNIYVRASQPIRLDQRKAQKKHSLKRAKLQTADPIITEVSTKDVWFTVWPEMYRIPTYLIACAKRNARRENGQA